MRVMRQPIGLPRIAFNARTNDILPRRLTACITRDHMVKIELLARQDPRTVLTGILIPIENVPARQLQFLAREFIEKCQQYHSRQTDRTGRRMNCLYRLERRITGGEIDPIHHRKHPEIIIVVMHHMRMPTGQQRKSSPSADDVDRLPKAI